MRKLNLTGEKFGQLTALKDVGTNKHGRYNWLCKCDCGNETVVDISNLRAKHTISCGCMVAIRASEANTTHGFTRGFKHPLFTRWAGMNSRCNNKNNVHYHNYGGRGIKNHWLTFESFRDDMLESFLAHASIHGERNTTIERVDNNGDYCKENCVWLTLQKQQQNRRPDKRYITT